MRKLRLGPGQFSCSQKEKKRVDHIGGRNMKKKLIKNVPVEKKVLFVCEYNSVISVFVSFFWISYCINPYSTRRIILLLASSDKNSIKVCRYLASCSNINLKEEERTWINNKQTPLQENIYIPGLIHQETQFVSCFKAENIFNHMGPNMARGWECDSAGTKLKFSSSSVDNRTKQVLKVKSF